MIPYLEALAGRIGDRDLVLVEARDAGVDTHVLALPLAYIYARNVLVLNSARPDKAKLQLFLEDAGRRYDRVLFLGGGQTDLLSRRIQAAPIADGRVKVPEYDSSPWNVYPTEIRRKDFDYSLYTLSLDAPLTGAFVLDVGDRDDLNVVRFNAKETSDGRSVRWTLASSQIAVPGLGGHERELQLVMHDGGRPAAAVPARVTVSFNDVELGTIEVGPGFQTYQLALPADLVARAAAQDDPAQIRLRSTVWIPRDVIGGNDGRSLGVMLDRVEIRVVDAARPGGLQIYAPRERALVRAADLLLAPLAWGRRGARPATVRQVLLLRLERIGDLLMVLDAIADARAAWPDAAIDLAVGSWNAPLAALIPGVREVLVADVPWLAREGAGDGWPTLLAKAKTWRRRGYDVVVNFEPDIRSNVLAWRSRAASQGRLLDGGRWCAPDDRARVRRHPPHVGERPRAHRARDWTREAGTRQAATARPRQCGARAPGSGRRAGGGVAR